jgi:hypothetical protein
MTKRKDNREAIMDAQLKMVKSAAFALMQFAIDQHSAEPNAPLLDVPEIVTEASLLWPYRRKEEHEQAA